MNCQKINPSVACNPRDVTQIVCKCHKPPSDQTEPLRGPLRGSFKSFTDIRMLVSDASFGKCQKPPEDHTEVRKGAL